MSDGLPPLREVIANYQLAARKSLGQNFLLDLNLTGKIARAAGDLTTHDVLEIGPGPGGLTRALLANNARHIVAIERDNRCIPALEEIARAYPGRLTILEGDAKEIDPLPYLSGPIRVVANLPYNIGTELFVRWMTPETWPPFWDSLTLMFQKEVAQRIVAQVGDKAYGRLALLSQWRSDPRIAMTLPASAFTPPPKVNSAVIHATARPEPRFAADAQRLQVVVAAAFNQRRKMLRSALKPISQDTENWLEGAGIDPTRRAETLTLEEFCRLSRAS